MLKRLLQEIDNQPVFYDYLRNKGYSKQLLYKYVKSGWLEKVSTGVYKKKGVNLKPLDILKAYSLQLKINFHIGAQSALYLSKIAQYLKFEEKYLIFLHPNTKVNSWLKSLDCFSHINKNILIEQNIGLRTEDHIQISSIERALIEMAALVPTEASMEELYEIIKLLPNIDVDLIQKILVLCSSIKAKRVFLFLADKVSHKWFKKIKMEEIDLGKGVRQIVKNGIFYKDYMIVASREFSNGF